MWAEMRRVCSLKYLSTSVSYNIMFNAHPSSLVQLAVNLHDFQDAEPDILVHSTPAIVEWFKQQGIKCKFALKALCRKKGLRVEVLF